jgi:hypothetical protein
MASYESGQRLEAVVNALLPSLHFLSAEQMRATTLELASIVEEAARAREVVEARRQRLREMEPEEFVREAEGSGGGVAAKRPRADDEEPVTVLEAADVWDSSASEAQRMMAALADWSEVTVMWETVRLQLALQPGRVCWGRPLPEPLVDRWFGAYRLIRGLPRSATGLAARHSFGEVCRALLAEDGRVSASWSGQAGAVDCEAAECQNSACDGRHMGLRVACRDTLPDGTVVMRAHRQIGLCYDPASLLPFPGSSGAALRRLELVQRFLEASDNVCREQSYRHVYMVGMWGLVEHCCAGPPIAFDEQTALPHLPHSRAVHLIAATCDWTSHRGYCVWNYGGGFRLSTQCMCYVCQNVP